MKRTKLRHQLYIFQILFSLVLFLFLALTYYSYENQYKKDISTTIQNEVDLHKVKVLSSLQTAAKKLQKQKDHFISIHKDTLKILQNNPSYDLEKLKSEIKSRYLSSYIDVELFLIDKRYTIYKTTYPKDLGFNLSVVTEAKIYLDKTTKDGKIYISDIISTDALDMKYKLYSYSKLSQSTYFEMGFIDNTLTNAMESLVKDNSNSLIKVELYNVSKDDKQYYYYLMQKRDFIKSKEEYYSKTKKIPLDKKTDDKIINTIKSDSQIEVLHDGIHTVYTKVFDNDDMFAILGFKNIIMKVDIDVSEKLEFLNNFKKIFFTSLIIILLFLIGLSIFIKNKFTKPIENILASLTSHSEVKDNSILSLNNELSDISRSYNTLLQQLTTEIDLNKHLQLIDPLTKSYNRKAYESSMTETILLFNRYNIPFSLILLDIDDFKQVNDIYGHLTGDRVLIDIVTLINKNIRDTDTLYRVGGEEFIILCKNTLESDATKVAEKLRATIEKSLNTIEDKIITVSIGVTQVAEDDTKDSIYKRGDENLYFSKESGKNRVTSN